MHAVYFISFLCGIVTATLNGGQTPQVSHQAQGSGTCNGGISIDFQCGGMEEKLDEIIASIAGINPEWNLVFKVVSGNGGLGPYAQWDSQAPLNEDVPAAQQLDDTFSGTFKSSFVLNWERRNIIEVKVALLSPTGTELMAMIFDGEGTNKFSWFSRDRLLHSPYDDIHTETQNFFSIAGDTTHNRRWFININYGGCSNDAGWLVAVTKDQPACSWETPGPTRPHFLYSTKRTFANWNSVGDIAEAKLFTIFVKSKSRYI